MSEIKTKTGVASSTASDLEKISVNYTAISRDEVTTISAISTSYETYEWLKTIEESFEMQIKSDAEKIRSAEKKIVAFDKKTSQRLEIAEKKTFK